MASNNSPDQPDDQQSPVHYFASGHQVHLHPSHDFVAVATQGAATAAHAGEAAATPGTLVLADRNLVLVPTARPDAVAAAQDSVRADGETPSTATVFESEEAPGVYLVPSGEVIVKMSQGADGPVLDTLLSDRHAHVVRSDYPEPGVHLVAADSPDDTLALANALHGQDGVEYAEPNFVHVSQRPVGFLPDVQAEVNLPRTSPEVLNGDGPSAPDPSLTSQWGLTKIRAIEAWGITTGSPSITVAVIDEGVDVAHEDLSLALPGYDAFQQDNDPNPDGNDAHGTACSGIVSARKDNGKGGSGVAPGCKVLPVRIAKGIGNGFWQTDSAKVADGIKTAVNRGASVLSNSYGVGPSSLVTDAFAYAATAGRGGRGCVIAAASGNGDVGNVIYPARLSPSVRGMLAVGASNEWDQRKSKTSNDGENWWGSQWGPELDIVAPGVHIFTTDITGGAGYAGGNYVPNFNGTSSATPHVAGVAALVLSVDPDLRGWEVEDILKLTAVDLGAAGRDDLTGYGRVDARRAVEAASKLWYSITPQLEFVGGRACTRLNARLYNPGINTIRLDSFTLTSHTADWSQEVDRFEYRPNPGNIMLARSGHDVRFNGVLLKANGTPASWSYRWSASWTYAFWRPAAPAFPLAVGRDQGDPMAGPQATGQGSTRDGAEGIGAPGSGSNGSSSDGLSSSVGADHPHGNRSPAKGQRVDVDTGSGRTVTIVVH